jgi:hypothetical protein
MPRETLVGTTSVGASFVLVARSVVSYSLVARSVVQ